MNRYVVLIILVLGLLPLLFMARDLAFAPNNDMLVGIDGGKYDPTSNRPLGGGAACAPTSNSPVGGSGSAKCGPDIARPVWGDGGVLLEPTVAGIGEVDDIVDALEWGNIVFNAPKTMQFNESGTIELRMSPTKSPEELEREFAKRVPLETAQVRISNLMKARLAGQGFTIDSLAPEVQAVGSLETTQWKWEIYPISPGLQSLRLTLSAIITVSNQSAPLVVRTYDRSIEVNITIQQRVRGFIVGNWQWLWAAFFIPLGAFLWNLWARPPKAG